MSSAADVPPPKPTLQVSTAVTATDHGQIVVLVAWLCFTAGLLLSLVRVYIRWPLNALAGKDDGAYAVSAIFAIIQTAITINAVSNGFGRTESELSDTQVVDAAKVSRRPSPLQDEQFSHRNGQLASYPRQSLIAFLGHLRNRSHIRPLHVDRKALRLLPLHPPRPRIEQDASRMGSQCTGINIRHHITHQCRRTPGHLKPLVIP